MAFMPADKREQFDARIRREAFARITSDARWGEENLSGGGSTLEFTEVTREILKRVVAETEVSSIVDVACGDFTWMPVVLSELDAQVHYTGCDIVPQLIERHQAAYPDYQFRVLDFVADKIPDGELIVCRDALQHLNVDAIRRALHNFSGSGAQYLLATTHLRRSGWRNARDKRVGQCADRNLLLKPFDLCDPIAIYSEQRGDKFLGLWKLPLTNRSGNPI